jgi:hypothetical protein
VINSLHGGARGAAVWGEATMLKYVFVAVTGIALLAGSIGQADAAKRKLPKGAIATAGCTEFRPPMCNILRTPGGKTYSLIGSTTPIPYNTGIAVVGIPEGDVGICFTQSLRVLSWHPVKIHCPLK